MPVRDDRREAALELMADHVLAEGLNGARLRSLAAAAGTSDRMLLYYFADKDELLAATLGKIAARLTAMLDSALPAATRMPPATLLAVGWAALGSAAFGPYMRVWLELAAGAARHQHPHRAIATAIMNGFVAWTSDHLDIADADERNAVTALLLATTEGCLFLDAVGRRDLADAAIARAANDGRQDMRS